VLTGQVIGRIINKAHELGIPVAVDPKRRNFDAYRDVALFKPNLKELTEGSRLDSVPKSMEDLAGAATAFQKQQNIDHILVTLSEKGIFISSKEENDCITHHIPAHIRTVADVSGAGDTVISVAALCLASQLPPYDMAAISNLAGGLVCEYIGVVPVKRDRLVKEVFGLYMID
jgi:rfaE bifunctional protein kinase chain/domain